MQNAVPVAYLAMQINKTIKRDIVSRDLSVCVVLAWCISYPVFLVELGSSGHFYFGGVGQQY